MIGDLEEINEIVNLVRNLRDYVMKTECFAVKSGVSFPPYFRCPLSLELMLDPVIVASGQTYERQSIQKWLDHGMTVCPKTRQRLTHTNLVPNYTVKAMSPLIIYCLKNYLVAIQFQDHVFKLEMHLKNEVVIILSDQIENAMDAKM
ncbi:U-box domain-containing protein 3-like [Trifolium medium]|uniref:RING-type E3 ubiquitin transferase n=1 Tax=Trifolium medium TaxID=97028 RepID=A0A392PTM2_9FABA|nr:U-box domain-containing protein 3-like [Trifolium medium]